MKEIYKIAKKISKNNFTIPVLQNNFSVVDNKGYITNLTESITFTTDLPNGVYNVEVLGDETSGYNLYTTEYDVIDYPELGDRKGLLAEITLTADDIKSLVEATKFTSKDKTRPVLTGVCLHKDFCVATDGYILYKNTLQNNTSVGDNEFILTKEFIGMLNTLKPNEITLEFYENERVDARYNMITLHSGLIYGRYPDIEALIKTHNPWNYWECDAKDFKAVGKKSIRWDEQTGQLDVVFNDKTAEIDFKKTKKTDTTPAYCNKVVIAMCLQNHKLAKDNGVVLDEKFFEKAIKPFKRPIIGASANKMSLVIGE